jgi:hypothetical protein
VNQLMVDLDRACPGFVPDAGDVELPYIWMGDFVRHVIRTRLAGREAEVGAVFDVIERCVATIRPGWEPSEEANLAVVGFLEDLQNGNLHPEGSSPADFRAYLGPRSLERWEHLNGFWEMVEHSKGGK